MNYKNLNWQLFKFKYLFQRKNKKNSATDTELRYFFGLY